MEEELQQKKPTDDSVKVKANPDFDTDLFVSPKKQKKIEEINIVQSQVSNHIDHQDISINGKNTDYCSFSTIDKKSSESKTEKPQSNPIQELLNHTLVSTSDPDSEDDDQQKKIAAAKKLLFPSAVATSFTEVVDTLRDERRQEFCPIYKDETPEERTARLAKQKPVGSLLAKRIRWDDLKRKRDDERQAQIPIRYGSYGPVYANQQQSLANSYGQYNRNTTNQSQPTFTNPYEQYNGNMQNQSQQSFANPYEQYYAAVQHQYAQMVQMAHAQQQHAGFWPGYNQQSSPENNNPVQPNSMQQQNQSYTYPYPTMPSNNIAGMNTNSPLSYTSTDYLLYLNNLNQPPPPPPNEPYPY